ncbi:MAG: SH3 domain-containing protein [Paracoccus sp. (in: a-proteobacteria)]|nr:SH3 domain-containing protein [Paracoccus sp. (in: a-proteobacteria)]
MRALILSLALLAAPAHATPEYQFPGLFDVTGVAAADVLNLRDRPDARAEIIGSLAPDARNIEVVAQADGWARVNLTEASGWVSMRFLSYHPDIWRDDLPASLGCFGTEPFWSIGQSRTGLLFSTPEAQRDFGPAKVLRSENSTAPQRAVIAGAMTLVITPGACSDGMSDRAFGLQALAIMGGDVPRLLTGCCSVQP